MGWVGKQPPTSSLAGATRGQLRSLGAAETCVLGRLGLGGEIYRVNIDSCSNNSQQMLQIQGFQLRNQSAFSLDSRLDS